VDRDYFNKYYNLERTHWWFLVRAKLIVDTIKSRINCIEPLSILNIGSATGRTSEILQEFGVVTSIEFDKECFEFAKNILKMPVINGSITDLPFTDKKFDLVCAFDVVEHVQDDTSAISEMHRVCKPSGHLFLTVPAFQSLWSMHDEINHHYRRYRKKSFLKLFSNKKGQVIKFTYFNSILFVPIYMLRRSQNILSSKKKQRSRSDFEVVKSSFVNNIFYSIFNFERLLLKVVAFPFGVSLMLLWKKK
jgi:2-polyprenyl-3-methyl-5-hydroxy-6-metoxy-1,4-benzoquinol methylase